MLKMRSFTVAATPRCRLPSFASISRAHSCPKYADATQSEIELDAIKEQLQAFIKQHRLPYTELPTAKQLRQAGRQDLLNAIHQSGGARKLSADSRFPLTTVRQRPKPSQGLDFTIQAVRRFIEQQKLPAHQMPSILELKQAQRCDLLRDIQHHGGLQKVAEHMLLQMRPRGRRGSRGRTHIEAVAEAVQAWVRQHFPPKLHGQMPSHAELKQSQGAHLSNLVAKHGTNKIAEAAGLQLQRGKGRPVSVSLLHVVVTACQNKASSVSWVPQVV